MKKKEIVDLILKRLNQPIKSFNAGNFKYYVISDLLPLKLANEIADKFPSEENLRKRDTLREYKRVGVDFEIYDPIMESITFAFHDSQVVNSIEKLTGFKKMIPDKHLYAGGLSSMSKNSFLNPHLDNSHNDDKTLYRALNLLYYVSKDWKIDYGGNLILFPNGMKSSSKTIHSKFNTLVLMETNNQSYHGVSKVINKSPRRCISKYYFSEVSTNGKNYNHVTSFFSFPKDSLVKRISLLLDRNSRQAMSSIFKKIINYKNWHKR